MKIAPVWNKSNREHTFVGSEPQSVFDAGKAAVAALGWMDGWHVDADHIRLETADRFLPCSDFLHSMSPTRSANPRLQMT